MEVGLINFLWIFLILSNFILRLQQAYKQIADITHLCQQRAPSRCPRTQEEQSGVQGSFGLGNICQGF